MISLKKSFVYKDLCYLMILWSVKLPSKEEAINEILRNKGTQFDPHLTDLFIEIIQNNEEL